ncbi:MAG: insulinase family protein [Deltaproteobacteria bacterium]|nr:insulinase family protein [Deltaproteobacteria bacterium]
MIIERILPNGLELVIKPTNAPVVAFQAWVDVGSIDESPAEAGYCHFLEHMLFKGTSRRTTAEIAGAVEGSGGDTNAFTSFEHTVYHITISNTRWRLANDILADMVLGSVFKPGEFSPEQEVILEEIRRSEDSPERQLYQGLYGMMYGSAGYGRPVIGYPRTVKACTAASLKKFWKRWYSPSLMTLVVCGDVDPAAVEKEVMKRWGKAGGAALRPRRRDAGFEQKIRPSRPTLGVKNFSVNSVRWVGSLPGPSMRDPILPALDLSSMILGSGESSRLYRGLFREKKLVTSVSTGVWAPAGTGLYTFDVEASVEQQGRFHAALRDEIRRFCDEGPTTEEIERSKVTMEADRIYSSQSSDDIASRLGYLKLSLGNARFDLEYLAETRDLTPEDVRDAARRFLPGPFLGEFALVPKKTDAQEFWSSTGTRRMQAPMKASHKKTTRVKNGARSPEIPCERLTFSNGIELLLFPRKDLPVVSIQACALGGLRAETRQNAGIGNLLSEVWEKGPAGYGAEAFAAYLERKASSIDSFSGRNSLGLSCTTLTHYLDDVVPLFCETLFNPALEASELERARTLGLEDIRTLEDNPGRLVGKLFCETLFEGHPYAFPDVGFEDSVKSVSPQSLSDHYREALTQRKIVVAASGKFNPARMAAWFEKIKRGAPGKEKSAAAFAQPGLPAPRVCEIRKDREQSHVAVGFLGTRVTDRRRYALKALLMVLGGQSGRLFTEIRDRQGLCYTVSPISFEGVDRGYVGVYIGCEPAKREQAVEAIRRELDRIATSPVSARELDRAKTFILGRHDMDMQLNSAIAATASLNVLYGFAPEEQFKWPGYFKQVTVGDVKDLAQELFTQPSVTALVV